MTSPIGPNRFTRTRRQRRPTGAWLDPLADVRARSVRALTYEWSIAQGRPVRRSTFDVIIGARAELGLALTCWRSEEVSSMLWLDAVEFCAQVDIEVPLDLAEALYAMLMALEITERLERHEPLDVLIEPLVSTGGLDDVVQHRALGLSPAG
ncbi:MAG: hypothetical protein IH940_05665 [Acidobacteria bacterium]|nr:hypothetical protein [Acidobacteriota bacterium]